MKANVRQAQEADRIGKAMRMGMYGALLVVNGKYGFAKKRLTDFGLEYFKTLDDYLERYGEVAVDAMLDHVKKLGFEDGFSELDWRKKVE
jgi:hypothetical protein